MKHSNLKLFIMFAAGILLSAITVFATTITLPNNFISESRQILQKLILTDGSGATGVVLDGINKKIQSDTICETDGSGCKSISSLFTGTDTDTNLTTGEVNLMESDPVFMATSGDFLRDELWSTGASNSINYMNGNVGIGTNLSNSKLDVNGDVNIKDELYMNGDRVMNLNGNSNILQIGDIDGGGFSTSIFDENNNKILNVIDGNVGIGTSNPTSKLDINGPTKINGNLIFTGSTNRYIHANEGKSISIKGGNAGSSYNQAGSLNIMGGAGGILGEGGKVYINGGSQGSLAHGFPIPANNIILAHNGTVPVLSNVGIGTNTPTSKLDVAGTGTFDAIVSDTTIKLGLGSSSTGCNNAAAGTLKYQLITDGSKIMACIKTNTNAYGWVTVVIATGGYVIPAATVGVNEAQDPNG